MPSPHPDRRRVLSACAGAVAASLAGCLGFLQNDVEFDDDVPAPVADHLATANHVDGSITVRTGEGEVHIQNGPGGDLAFDPPLVRVDVDTTVTWEWGSDGHTVTSTDGDWDVHTGIESIGYEFSYTFEAPGQYLYKCRPHAAAGHLGAILVD